MIILLGVAGSGKSVQGKLVAKSLNCKYFSTGEFLRQITNPEIQKKMLAGTLIDDKDVIKATESALLSNGHDKEFVLDGFLRTVPQVEWLIGAVKSGEFHVTAVISLKASPDAIKERLLSRNRPDDRLEIIKKRLDEYDQTIKPIVSMLKEANVEVYDIDADRSIEEVNASIMDVLNPKITK